MVDGGAWLRDVLAVGDFPGLDGQAVAHLDVSPARAVAECRVAAVCQSLKRYKAHAAFLVGEVGPQPVVEDVGFQSIDGFGQRGDLLRSGRVLERGRVDGEAGHVVQVGVRDQVRADEVSKKVQGVGFGGLMWKRNALERSRRLVGSAVFARLSGAVVFLHDFGDARQVHAGVDGENRAPGPADGRRPNQEPRDVGFDGPAGPSLGLCEILKPTAENVLLAKTASSEKVEQRNPTKRLKKWSTITVGHACCRDMPRAAVASRPKAGG